MVVEAVFVRRYHHRKLFHFVSFSPSVFVIWWDADPAYHFHSFLFDRQESSTPQLTFSSKKATWTLPYSHSCLSNWWVISVLNLLLFYMQYKCSNLFFSLVSEGMDIDLLLHHHSNTLIMSCTKTKTPKNGIFTVGSDSGRHERMSNGYLVFSLSCTETYITVDTLTSSHTNTHTCTRCLTSVHLSTPQTRSEWDGRRIVAE